MNGLAMAINKSKHFLLFASFMFIMISNSYGQKAPAEYGQKKNNIKTKIYDEQFILWNGMGNVAHSTSYHTCNLFFD